MTAALDLTPTQALGVALSVQAGSMVMGEAQDRAPDMLDHLQRMGFTVVPFAALDRAEAVVVAADKVHAAWVESWGTELALALGRLHLAFLAHDAALAALDGAGE